MYEQFLNQLTMSLSERFSTEEIRIIREKLDLVSYDYDITKKETALEVYNFGIPMLVNAYLICKRTEGLSEATIYNYGTCLRLFFEEIHKAPEQVTANDIRVFLYQYQKRRGVSNRTLDKYRKNIGCFFKWAQEEEYIPKNPTKTIKAIRYEDKPRQALTQVELEHIRKGCVTLREKAVIEVLYSTGCRVSELTNLKKSDINWNDKSVHILGKGKKHRISFLNAKAEVALKEYLASRTDENDSIFVSVYRPHGPIKKDAVERILQSISQRVVDNVDKKVTPHILRHTTATIAIQNGMPVEDISKLLGHSQLDTTMIYAKNSMANVQAGHRKYIV